MIVRLIALFVLISTTANAQHVIDSCFLSVAEPGQYFGSENLRNLCGGCVSASLSSDLLQWNPGGYWEGVLPFNTTLDLPPPPRECVTRAIWVGSSSWTSNGEAFGLRLDAPLVAGQTYTFEFTYAADGEYSDEGFIPAIYTNSEPKFYSTLVDSLPIAENQWTTHSLTFTAKSNQNGHDWLITRSVFGSGMILSNCKQNPLSTTYLPSDTTICGGDTIMLSVPFNEYIQYQWNTGATEPEIAVNKAGTYEVEMTYYACTTTQATEVIIRDCEARLIMPNFFSPNGDDRNATFVPMESNFISSGEIWVLNRWGELLFTGDLFKGWDGKVNGRDSSTGVYYYKIIYHDELKKKYEARGIVSLAR